MKTIKEIADEIGVSKTAVRNHLTDDFRKTYVHWVCGVIHIDKDGEKLIKSEFVDDKEKETPQTTLQSNFAVVCGEDSILIDELREQLHIKDKQILEQQESIRELTRALENTTKSLQAAQALHAGTMQQNYLEAESKTKEKVDEIITGKKEEKKGFFSRLFGIE